MNLPITPPDVEQTTPGLLRLSAAAALAKISPELFEDGVESGAIPLQIIRIGKRFKFINACDLGAWLHGRQTS